MIDKTVDSVAAAVAGIRDGATVMIGGFGEAGSPIELIHALIDQGARDLTVISNNTLARIPHASDCNPRGHGKMRA